MTGQGKVFAAKNFRDITGLNFFNSLKLKLTAAIVITLIISAPIASYINKFLNKTGIFDFIGLGSYMNSVINILVVVFVISFFFI